MSRKERMEGLMERLQNDLSLSTEQSTRIRSLVMGHGEQRKLLKKQHGDNKEARKAAIKPLNQKLRQDIGSVLDHDQKEVFQTNKSAYKALLRG